MHQRTGIKLHLLTRMGLSFQENVVWVMQCTGHHQKMHDGFHDMVEYFVEIFMDDFSVFGESFDMFLENLNRVVSGYEETNLVLNWEKCNFLGKEGIVLGHKV